MGQCSIMFNSYVKLPEGIPNQPVALDSTFILLLIVTVDPPVDGGYTKL